MYKYITAVAMLSISQLSIANDNSNVWSCVDSSKLEVEATCMMELLEVKINDSFYNELEQTSFESQVDAFATITHFPQENLIVVKSLEAKNAPVNQAAVLIASNY